MQDTLLMSASHLKSKLFVLSVCGPNVTGPLFMQQNFFTKFRKILLNYLPAEEVGITPPPSGSLDNHLIYSSTWKLKA